MAAAPAAAAPAETKEPDVTTPAGKEVAKTSLATRGTPPGEVTVQFRRWTAYGQTAYQRGQFAGFPASVAEQMERAGAVVLDPAYRREPATNRMMRK
jgi:predicted metal-dependent phosphoesterase TrpH